MNYSIFAFIFPYFFVSVPCARAARLSWPSRQHLSARKYAVSYRKTGYALPSSSSKYKLQALVQSAFVNLFAIVTPDYRENPPWIIAAGV